MKRYRRIEGGEGRLISGVSAANTQSSHGTMEEPVMRTTYRVWAGWREMKRQIVVPRAGDSKRLWSSLDLKWGKWSPGSGERKCREAFMLGAVTFSQDTTHPRSPDLTLLPQFELLPRPPTGQTQQNPESKGSSWLGPCGQPLRAWREIDQSQCGPRGTMGTSYLLRESLPCWCSGKESACQCRRYRFDPWSGKIPHATEKLSPWAIAPEPVLQSPRATASVPRCPRACAPQQEKLLQREAHVPQWRAVPTRHN